MPQKGDIRYVAFKVNCLREPYNDRDMQMKFLFTETGTWFPAPCNGCEMMDAHEECKECTSRLTSMFYRDPDLDISKPLYLNEEVTNG